MIYLDNSATTKVLPEIMDTFVAVNETYWANPSSIHEFGHKTNQLLQSAREQIAEILRTASAKIYFTSGGTESNNLAIFGLANKYKFRGKHVLISQIEHPSIIEAAKQLVVMGFEVEWIPVDASGIIDLNEFSKLIRAETMLVSIMHVNNETGAVQPLKALSTIVRRESKAVIHVDAVQSFGKLSIDFKRYDIDAITISSHKIHGIKGSGLLALSKTREIEPILFGGGQESGIRSGTTPVPLAVSTAKAMRIASTGLEKNSTHMKNLTDELVQFLHGFERIKMISPENRAPHIVTFSVRKIKGEVIINALQKRDVIVSTSSACSSRQTKTSHVLKAMHISDDYIKGVIRLSISPLTTEEEIETFKKIFTEVMNVIKGD
ncbi:cysteine desulfurase family protein [Psychrobacillus sp. MER TA 171]|uniref:cysteine desulfurase family protein n=1 Tax=Psychrobacillus sp. MER TA 171 TaxID=2939577 RepID=UPI00204147C5|nr:cysteine desulfurase family protein [Psychrobacillus sp. MER TA 171]MCM3360241.1 cysteine desulfurase [Psychrobacillus sp. MER TA 171]